MKLANSIIGPSLWVLLIRLLGAALQLILIGLVIYMFPIETVGENAILWSCAVIARVGGTFGVDLYLLRELPELWNKSDARMFYGRSYQARRSHKLVVGILSLVLLCVFIWLSRSQVLSFQMAVSLPVVIFFSASQRALSCQIRAEGRIIWSQAQDALLIPILAICSMFLIYSLDIDALLYAQSMSVALSYIIIVIISGRHKYSSVNMWLSWYQWRLILPLGVGSMLSVLSSRAPLIFLGIASITQAAIYDVGQRIHSGASLSATSASSVMLPRVKGLWKRGEHKILVRELYTASLTGLLPAAAVLLVLSMLGADGIGTLLGGDYRDAWVVSMVLVGSACVSAAAGLCHGFLAMMGRNKTFTSISLVQFVIILTYGLFWNDGSALGMATAILVLEILRGGTLIFMTCSIIRNSRNESNLLMGIFE